MDNWSKPHTNIFGVTVDEKLRLKLLKKEQKMRKKQPEPWTKTKYRAYANFKAKKKDTKEAK
jgi:hypothetical protein